MCGFRGLDNIMTICWRVGAGGTKPSPSICHTKQNKKCAGCVSLCVTKRKVALLDSSGQPWTHGLQCPENCSVLVSSVSQALRRPG